MNHRLSIGFLVGMSLMVGMCVASWVDHDELKRWKSIAVRSDSVIVEMQHNAELRDSLAERTYKAIATQRDNAYGVVAQQEKWRTMFRAGEGSVAIIAMKNDDYVPVFWTATEVNLKRAKAYVGEK